MEYRFKFICFECFERWDDGTLPCPKCGIDDPTRNREEVLDESFEALDEPHDACDECIKRSEDDDIVSW